MRVKSFFCTVLLIGACATAVPTLAETTLRVSLQLPLKHHLGQNILDFQKEVESNSKGEIKVQIFPSAQLFKDNEVHQAVTSGAVEMGIMSLTKLAGTIPAVDIFYIPFMFPSQEKVAAATSVGSPVRSLIDDAILETGARVLWWNAYGGVALLSKKKGITLPDDMKGMKVRVFGKTLGEFVKSVEGAPVSMAGSEQFLAYQRGTVDAGMTGVSAVGPRKLYQVMDYLTITNHADIEFITIINDKFWKKISPENQKIITAAALKVEAQLREKIKTIESDAIIDAEKNMTVIHLSDEDISIWREKTGSVADNFLENSGPLGKKVMEAAKSL